MWPPIKRRFAEEGLEGVLQDRPQAHRYRKLDDRGEAHLIALACSEPPAGTGRAPAGGPSVGALPIPRDGVQSGRRRSRSGASAKVSAEFVAHMEDVLDLYAEPFDPQRPVVCFDETSTQLL